MKCYYINSPEQLPLLKKESPRKEIPEKTAEYIRLIADRAKIIAKRSSRAYYESEDTVTEEEITIDAESFIVYRDMVCGYFYYDEPTEFPPESNVMRLYSSDYDNDYIERTSRVEMYLPDDLYPWARERIDVPKEETVMRLADYYMSDAYEISIPAGITEIESNVFSSFRHLKTVHYAGTAAQWCDVQLCNYTSNPCLHGAKMLFQEQPLIKLEIPDTVTELGRNQFYQMGDLTEVVLPGSIPYIRSFGQCDSLKKVIMKEGVQTIGEFAFSFCPQLETVFLPRSLKRIDDYAFSKSVRIQAVYYAGTREEWEQISCGYSIDLPKSDMNIIHFCGGEMS